MKNGHSAFLVFLNKDHVSAYKRYHINIDWVFVYLFFLAIVIFSLILPPPYCRLCMVVPALKGRGVADVIANAR